MIYYYLLLIFLIITSAIKSQKKEKICIYLSFIYMSLIAGLRHISIGNDTLNYYNHYIGIASNGIKYINNSRFEIGYSYLVMIFTKLGISYNVFLMIITLIINLIICNFIIKQSKKPSLSAILFVLMRFFFDEMNIFRQFISVALIILAFEYIKKRKIIPYFILIICASLFHYSALIAGLLYFIYWNKEFSSKIKTLLLVITCFIYSLMGPILIKFTDLFGIYSSYIEKYIGSNKIGNIIIFIINLLIYLLYEYFYKRKENCKNVDNMDKFYYNLSYTIVLLSLLNIKFSVFSRIVIYFQLFNIIILPHALSKIKNIKNYMLMWLIIVILFFIYFLILTYYKSNWNMVNPYRFFWN